MEAIIGIFLILFVVGFVVLFIYYFIVDYWPIILGVLIVALLVWIAVKIMKKHLNEKAATAWENRELEIRQLRERNDSMQRQIEEHNERISHLREQIYILNSHSREIDAFNDLFSAIGTSTGKEISENQAIQIRKMQSQLVAYEEKIEKLKSEIDLNQTRINTIC